MELRTAWAVRGSAVVRRRRTVGCGVRVVGCGVRVYVHSKVRANARIAANECVLLVPGGGPNDLGKQAPGSLLLIKLRRFDDLGIGERRQPIEETIQGAVLPLCLPGRPEISEHSRE